MDSICVKRNFRVDECISSYLSRCSLDTNISESVIVNVALAYLFGSCDSSGVKDLVRMSTLSDNFADFIGLIDSFRSMSRADGVSSEVF